MTFDDHVHGRWHHVINGEFVTSGPHTLDNVQQHAIRISCEHLDGVTYLPPLICSDCRAVVKINGGFKMEQEQDDQVMDVRLACPTKNRGITNHQVRLVTAAASEPTDAVITDKKKGADS